MEDMPHHLDSYQRAGMRLTPCNVRQKTPAFSGWQRLATDDPTLHQYWFVKQRFNPAMMTGHANRLVIVDVDRVEMVERFMDRYGDLVRSIVRTPRGGAHFGFQWPGWRVPNAVKVRTGDLEYDLRGDGGYVLCPPAETENGRYRFARAHWFEDPERLATFPEELMPPAREIKPEPKRIIQTTPASLQRIARGRAYGAFIKCIPGQRAHSNFYRFVCFLKNTAGCTRQEAEIVIEEWNLKNCFREDGASYPWSPSEVSHKLRSIYGY